MSHDYNRLRMKGPSSLIHLYGSQKLSWTKIHAASISMGIIRWDLYKLYVGFMTE